MKERTMPVVRALAGAVSFAAGYHKIRVAFFDAGAGGHLGVFWQPPGM